jgi:adenosylhomocysteine nucleosidase
MSDARVAELVERAFDYRGYVTVRRTDGSQVVGFLYDRGASHIELFDESATKRFRLDLAEVADIALTGEDAARKSQEIWARRKGTLEPRDTPAWGEWHDAGPVLVVVGLDIELRSVARALRSPRRGSRVRGRLGGADAVALAIGLGGGARRALAEERPRLVVSCGFSGALDDALAPGDLVLATSVRDETGETIAADASLLRAAQEALPRARQGELLCTTSVATSEQEKRAFTRPGTLAIDMESYPVARAAAELGVPWLAVRAIVDPLASSLPPFTAEPRPSYLWPAVRYALSGPGASLELVRLARRARKARGALEAALRSLAPVAGAVETRP